MLVMIMKISMFIYWRKWWCMRCLTTSLGYFDSHFSWFNARFSNENPKLGFLHTVSSIIDQVMPDLDYSSTSYCPAKTQPPSIPHTQPDLDFITTSIKVPRLQSHHTMSLHINYPRLLPPPPSVGTVGAITMPLPTTTLSATDNTILK